MAEFTGERVIPGEVNLDLWNEHIARYTFAARQAAGKRVLDAGCGTGYGAAELARTARNVTGADLSREPLHYARQHYALPNLTFVQATCLDLPFPARTFDLVVAFELIEHLARPDEFLAEMGRILTTDGLFFVSTPNKRYYAESRKLSGPNLFHEHEFEFDEFREALAQVFPRVTLLVQNRVESFAFHPVAGSSAADVQLPNDTSEPETAHFFVAVCAFDKQPEARSYVYVPSAGNILREREQHIELLEKELAASQRWLEETRGERDHLIELHRRQSVELEEHNRWAQELNARLAAANDCITRERTLAERAAAGYAAKVADLEDENRRKTEWALETERRLGQELADACTELVRCVELLDRAEATVQERSTWALGLQAQVEQLEAVLNLLRASRWLKLGRQIGLGPVLPNQ